MKCNKSECNLPVFPDYEHCVLHCKKGDYSADRNNGILKKFYDELVKYITKNLFESWGYRNRIMTPAQIEAYLKKKGGDKRSQNPLYIDNVIFDQIFFPCRDGRDTYDYLNVLSKLSEIHFNFCKFAATSIEIDSAALFYQDCEFHKTWFLTHSRLLPNESNVLYQACTFHGDVRSCLNDSRGAVISDNLFSDCNFRGTLSFTNTAFSALVFNNTIGEATNCPKLEIENCNLEAKFSLNSVVLGEVLIKDSSFKENFEFKNNDVSNFEIRNANFKGLFDAHNTKFGSFSASECIFEDYVGFDRCEFGQKGFEENKTSTYTDVTFLSFTNFGSAKFNSGLELKNTNLKELPNFMDVEVAFKETNRETFRIIKHSFDKIGNYIEANKFFVLEMKKYKEELKVKPFSQEKFVFLVNSLVSDFGSSYLRPLLWLIGFSFLYFLLTIGYQHETLYQMYPPLNSSIAGVVKFLNGLASSVLPFEKFLKEGMEFISLLFYIVFAGLIWQTIIAVKRHVRR